MCARPIMVRALFVLVLFAIYGERRTGSKKKVNGQTDLPRFTYAVQRSASELVQADDATFNGFAEKVRGDLDSIFRDYDIADKSTMRELLTAKLDLQELAGEYEPALATVDAIRALEEKPAQKLLSNLSTRAMLQAAIEAKSTSGTAFDQAFSRHYQQAIEPLPWQVVQDSIKAQYAGARLASSARELAFVKEELDPAVQKSGALDNNNAWDLVGVRNNLRWGLAVAPSRAAVLKRYIAAHNAPKPDIWAAREVTLSKDESSKPVLVAIWDSGIDISLFPDQLFTDPKPTVSGTHGIAVDDRGNPSKSWLYPLTPEQQARYPEVRDEIKGRLDIQDGIESPEADALEKKMHSLTVDQMHQLIEVEKIVFFYIHGTHCAGIAVRGNPAARLVVARFNDQLPDLPFAPTPEWARQMGAAFQQMSDYFRTRNVRVVNMSWGDDVAEFETWLSKTGGGSDAAERKKRAQELYAIWSESIEKAIKGAPNTLFVTAAGNADANTGFLGDVPSSLRLPNLIAVGAVNQAGDETSFTSYGDSVLVDAAGYQVESYVPGGARLKLSGTSMASPNVVNLAAKLFAVDPSLTPAEVTDLIQKGATTSEDGRRHLIDEKRSMALLRTKHSVADGRSGEYLLYRQQPAASSQ